MLRPGDEPAGRVENGTGEIEPLLDVHRMGRPAQRLAHLLRHAHIKVVKDLQRYRIAMRVGTASLRNFFFGVSFRRRRGGPPSGASPVGRIRAVKPGSTTTVFVSRHNDRRTFDCRSRQKWSPTDTRVFPVAPPRRPPQDRLHRFASRRRSSVRIGTPLLESADGIPPLPGRLVPHHFDFQRRNVQRCSVLRRITESGS